MRAIRTSIVSLFMGCLMMCTLFPAGEALATFNDRTTNIPLVFEDQQQTNLLNYLLLNPYQTRYATQKYKDTSATSSYRNSYPEEGLNTNFNYTKYLGTGDGFEPGATDADNSSWFPATADNFKLMRTDNYAPTPAEIDAWITICNRHGYKVRFVNNLDEITTDGSDPRVQIAVNQVILQDQESLLGGYVSCTIYFPPFFKAPLLLRYPMIIWGSGWGGGNNEIFSEESTSTYFADTTMKTYLELDRYHRGAICIQTNNGGEGSAGYTRYFLRDIAQMIDRLHTDFSGDRNRIMTIGSSTGGSVALSIAENPYEGDPDVPPYTVLGVISRGMPVGAGTKSQVPMCLIPTFGGMYTTVLGTQADRYNHNPPPLSNPAPVLAATMDTTDVWEADNRSADGQWVHKLDGKFIFLGLTVHDTWMGLCSYLNLDRKLSLNGIPHTSTIMLTQGHGGSPGDLGNRSQIQDLFLREMLGNLSFDPRYFKQPWLKHGLFEDARTYYIKDDLNVYHLNDWANYTKLDTQESLPFIASIPYKLGRQVRDTWPWHEPGGIELSGTIGRQWNVTIRDDTGTQVAQYSGVFGFGSDQQRGFAETTLITWGYEGLPNMNTTAYYTYEMWYEDANGEMRNVSSFTNFVVETPLGSGNFQRIAPKTIITETQPWKAEYFVTYGILPSNAMTALGIDWCEAFDTLYLRSYQP